MPTKNLTARTVGAIRPPAGGQVDYWDQSVPGFGLRVSAGGKMAWVIMYRDNDGRKRRHTFNTYPSMSVGDARDEAKALFELVAKGGDPATEKKSNRKAGTFNELADLYIEKYAKVNKRSWKKDESIIDKNLRPKWGALKAHSITRRDVNRLLTEIVERGAPIQANRVLEIVRKLYSWAIGTDRVEMDVNPCHEVKKPAKEQPRDRHLTADEIMTVWPMTGEGAKINDLFRIVLRLILVTAQRPGEVVGMPWAELDDDWDSGAEPFWTIPGERTKNGREHRIPLSPLAVDLLKKAKAIAAKLADKKTYRGDVAYVFPSPRGNAGMLESSLSHALIRSKHFGVPHFTPHDLRRTASTHLESPACGVSRFIVERVLNHVDQSVTGRHYALYKYDREKRIALNTWADVLYVVLKGEKPAANVVPIRSA